MSISSRRPTIWASWKLSTYARTSKAGVSVVPPSLSHLWPKVETEQEVQQSTDSELDLMLKPRTTRHNRCRCKLRHQSGLRTPLPLWQTSLAHQDLPYLFLCHLSICLLYGLLFPHYHSPLLSSLFPPPVSPFMTPPIAHPILPPIVHPISLPSIAAPPRCTSPPPNLPALIGT